MRIYTSASSYVTVYPSDESYRMREIMGDNSLHLSFRDGTYTEYPIGSYTVYDGITYTLRKPMAVTKDGEHDYSYDGVFEAPDANLKKYMLHDLVEKRLEFSFTASPEEFLDLIVGNLNERESGWTAGDYLQSPQRSLSFSFTYVYDALKMIADAFGCEFEIDGKTIHLKKLEYYKDNPLALAYGHTYGLVPGMKRENVDDKSTFETLNVQTTDRNLDYSVYGHKTLQLPANIQVKYNGSKFSWESGYKTTGEKTYYSPDGVSIREYNVTPKTGQESGYDATEIYPAMLHTIKKVFTVKAETHEYDIVIDAPEDLNYDATIIAGETPTMVFQSGMLSGKEFDLQGFQDQDGIVTSKYYENGKFIGWRIGIVAAEIDGITMPEEEKGYKPVAGDTLRIFGVKLPDAYIRNDSTHTGASWEVMMDAVKYMYENSQGRYQFSGYIDPTFAKPIWGTISKFLRLGGYITFRDSQILPTASLIRITALKDFLNKPYSPELTLSNTTVKGSVGTALNVLETTPVTIKQSGNDLRNYSKRGFKNVEETLSLLADAFSNYTSGISPVYVKTMQMIVGNEATQFRFLKSYSSSSYVEDVVSITYNDDNGKATFQGTDANHLYLQHMTLGVTSITNQREQSDYKVWTISPAVFESPVLDPTKPYYLYAKCPRTGTTGEVVISLTAHDMEEETDYYYLLIAIINSEVNGDRSSALMFGFTEVLPGQITTDIIRSADGQTYFDLTKGEIGGKIVFSSSSEGLGNLEEFQDLEGEVATTNGKIDATADDLNNKIDAANTKITDLDYLKIALEKGTTTTIDGGVVLSQLIGVLDVANKVKAMMNGSNAYKDATHGKMLIVSGMDGVQNINSAKTTIYEDGTLKTTELVADGSTIGGFRVSKAQMVNKIEQQNESGSYTLLSEMTLASDLIRFRNSKDSIALGSNVMPAASGGLICTMAVNVTTEQPLGTSNTGILIDVTGSSDTTNEYKNFAMVIRNGVVAGLRPLLTVQPSACTFSSTEHTIICTPTSYTNYYLPASPQDGQEYEIWHMNNAAKIRVTTQSRHRILRLGASYNDYVESSNAEIIRFIFSSGVKGDNGVYGTWFMTYDGKS